MKKKLKQIAAGIIQVENIEPIFTPASIDEILVDDISFTGEFTISSRTDEMIRGLVYVQSPSIRLKNTQFEGTECHIAYEVNGQCFPESGVIESKFTIVSDMGEYELPCKFSQESHVKGKGSGFPNTLEELAQMSIQWPTGAALIFEMEEFVHLPFMQDAKLQALYQGLHKQTNSVQALEEFLVGSQVKEPVSYELETTSGSYQVATGNEQNNEKEILIPKVLLHQKNAGSPWVDVSTDSPFIVLTKKRLTLEDFTDGQAVYYFSLDSEKMHAGKNFGYIIFKTPVQTLQYAVEAFTEEIVIDEEYKLYQKSCIQYTTLSTRLTLMTQKTGPNAVKLLEQMCQSLQNIQKVELGHKEEIKYILMEAALLVKLDKKTEAAKRIAPFKKKIQEEMEIKPFNYVMYQYLCYLIDNTTLPLADVCEILIQQVQKFPEDMDLLYLMLQIHPEYREDAKKTWEKIKEIAQGRRVKPELLAIAVNCLLKMPCLLENVESFECKVLNMALQQHKMSPMLAINAAVHVGAGRKFMPNMYYLYTRLYEYYPCKELLYTVCTILIKGDCRKSEFFDWYQKGIEADIRVTRLYDYYLYSLPQDYEQAFPRSLLLYYSYDHPKDIEIRNAIYQNVIRYYSRDEQIYRLYEEEIRGYVLEQFEKERVTPECSILYQHILEEDLIDEKLALTLIPMLCMWKITCLEKDVAYVICVVSGRKEEKKLKLRRGVAYISVYEDDFILLFENVEGMRYTSVPHTCEQVMNCPNLLERCEILLPEQQTVLSRHVQQIARKESYTKEDITLFEQLIGDDRTNPLFKHTLLNKCVHYYIEHAQEMDVDAYILQKASYLLRGSELIQLIEMFILNGCYSEAYDLIRSNGYEGIRPEIIFELCKNLIERMGKAEEALLVHMVGWSYGRGYFDENTLDYLAKWYHGSSALLYQILQDCYEAGIDTERLVEELLTQELFTGDTSTMDEVFRAYLKTGDVDELVQSAYLAARCHNYAVGYDDLPEDIFDIVKRKFLMPEQIKKMTTGQCLAVVRYWSETEVLEKEDEDILKNLLLRLKQQDICLSYTQKAAARLGYSTHSMIETRPLLANARIFVEYWIEGEEELYREEMRHVYGGIYTREVILFCKEQLVYRVYEEGIREVVDAGTMVGEDWLAVGSDRYALLNQMMLADNPQKLIEEYCKKEILLRDRFKLL